ncbi:hypothetical protein JCM19231_5893 [Vibrio ishigakensis]|nr:hypothetical protein JCM19231_5893 [Vibrio ishigakensis]
MLVITILQVIAFSSLLAAYPITQNKYSWLLWAIPAVAIFSPVIWIKAAAAATVVAMILIGRQKTNNTTPNLTPSV